MDRNTQIGEREPRFHRRRSQPRRMTTADLCVVIAASAVVMAMPSRTAWWASDFGSLPLYFFAMIGGLRLAVGLVW